jgi:hypothetical protein
MIHVSDNKMGASIAYRFHDFVQRMQQGNAIGPSADSNDNRSVTPLIDRPAMQNRIDQFHRRRRAFPRSIGRVFQPEALAEPIERTGIG